MASLRSSPPAAASKCGWRIRCTDRYAAGARHTAGYDGCVDWSPPNSPHPVTATTYGVVVRRATLSLDSDLTPDADLLVRAAHGAVWLADLPLADRLAEAAIHAGAGPELNFVRAHALSWLGRGEEAEAVLADIPTSQLTDHDHARFAFLRASNMLWALGDLDRAKELIDDASRTTPASARTHIDAFLTVYWFAMDEPDAAVQASKNLALEDIPVVGAEIAWVLAQIYADAGRATEAVAAADAGYAVATRSLDAPHMRFNIADAEVSALLLSGQITDALDVAERTRQQAANLPGAAQLLGAAVAGRAALGAGDLHSASLLLEQAAEGLSASHPIGWGYRYRIPHVTALAMRGLTREAADALDALDNVPRRHRSLDSERSIARAWVAAGQGGVSEAIRDLLSAAERAAAKGQFAAEVLCLQTATQFGDRTGAPRLHELESIVEGPRVGLAARFAAALRDGDGAGIILRIRGIRANGRSRCRRRRSRPGRAHISPPRPPGISVGSLDACRGPGRKMRRSPNAGASSGQRAVAAYRSRSRDRHVDR